MPLVYTLTRVCLLIIQNNITHTHTYYIQIPNHVTENGSLKSKQTYDNEVSECSIRHFMCLCV